MALDIRIAGRYRLGRKIGSGSFGDIYLGKKAYNDSPCSTIKNLCESGFWLTSYHLQVYTFTLGRRLASSWCALALPLTYATFIE
jgi:serine/threonine protein kinase